MNLHPDILAQAAFLPRPGSYRELRDMAGLIEERMAVLAEYQRSDMDSSSSHMVDYLIISLVERLVRASVQ